MAHLRGIKTNIMAEEVRSFLVPRIRLTPNTNIKSYFHRACQSAVLSLSLFCAAHARPQQQQQR